MKRLLAIVAAATLCLVLASPVAADSATTVPIHGFVAGSDGYAPPDTCPAGAGWRYTGTGGDAEFSHLGAVDFVITHCTWLDTPTTGHFGPGTVTLNAANGDRLVLEEQGTFRIVLGASGPLSLIHLDWTVIGGTGRFAHATGSGTADPVDDVVANTTSGTFDGVIQYAASDRSGR
jgi:opacity protein-like surface antigen